MGDGDVEQRLVRAGVELVAEAGSDAVSLREIARRAGVSHGAPRRYFPTRQALLAAVALEGYRELGALVEETLGSADDVREAMLALGRGYLAFARRRPGMFALMFRHDLLTGNNIGLRGLSTPIFGVLVKRLEHADVPEPAVTATALWAALHGLAELRLWGTLQVVTGTSDPDPFLTAAVDAHLQRTDAHRHQTDARPHQTDARSDQTDAHPHQTDGHPHQTDGHPHQTHAHSDQTDAHRHQTHARSGQTDSHLAETEEQR